jgi:steroid delta-isomerase-like uncharacterized protein
MKGTQVDDRHTENAKIALTIFEAWNDKDYERAFEILADDFTVVEVASGETYTGREGLIREYNMWHGAFSDGFIHVQNVIASGDRVAIETLVTGTHDGPFPTHAGVIEPTGRQLEFAMCTIALIKDGKYSVERHYFDEASMLKQLGVAS